MQLEPLCTPVELGCRDGFTLHAHLEPDPTAALVPSDGFDAEQVAAFTRGEWGFAELVVTASRAGTTMGRASLPGVVVGNFPQIGGVSYVRYRIDPMRGIPSPLARHTPGLCDRAIWLAQQKAAQQGRGR